MNELTNWMVAFRKTEEEREREREEEIETALGNRLIKECVIQNEMNRNGLTMMIFKGGE